VAAQVRCREFAASQLREFAAAQLRGGVGAGLGPAPALQPRVGGGAGGRGWFGEVGGASQRATVSRAGIGGRGGGSCWVLMENQLAFAHEEAGAAAEGSGGGGGCGVGGGGHEAAAARGKELVRSRAVKSSWRVKGVYASRHDAVENGRFLWLSNFGPDIGWTQCSQLPDDLSPSAARAPGDVTGEERAVGVGGGSGVTGGVTVGESWEGGEEEAPVPVRSRDVRGVQAGGRGEAEAGKIQGDGVQSGFLWAARLSGVDLSAGGGSGGSGAGVASGSNMYDLYVEFSVQKSDFGGTSPALF